MKISRVISSLVLSLLVAASAHANILVNGSFENPGQGNGSWAIYSSIPGWAASNSGVEVRNNVAGTAYAGSNFVELDTFSNSWIEQSLSTTLNQTFKLKFAYSPRTGVSSTSNPIDVYWNGNLVGSYTGNGSGGGNVWSIKNLTLLGNGGVSTLRFAASGTSDGYGGSLDDVQLNAVPEPTSLALFAAALMVLAFVRKSARR